LRFCLVLPPTVLPPTRPRSLLPCPPGFFANGLVFLSGFGAVVYCFFYTLQVRRFPYSRRALNAASLVLTRLRA
jgi:hypothetical protein